jgi:hypothetical protein
MQYCFEDYDSIVEAGYLAPTGDLLHEVT